MKYKRAINLSLTEHETVTVPDDEIWNVIIFKPAKGESIWGKINTTSKDFERTDDLTNVAGTPFRMGGAQFLSYTLLGMYQWLDWLLVSNKNSAKEVSLA